MSRFRVAVLLVAVLALLPAGASGQEQGQSDTQSSGAPRPVTLRDQLIGSWTMISFEATPPGGGPEQHFFGLHPKGILILDAGGHFAAVVSRPDRARMAAEPGGFAAQFGTWTVNESNKTLIRRIEAALEPSNEG